MICAASHKSTARWAFSQNSGELPNKRASHSAISELTPRRSRSNSLTNWRDVVWQEIFPQHLAQVRWLAFHFCCIWNTHSVVLKLMVITESIAINKLKQVRIVVRHAAIVNIWLYFLRKPS